MLKLKVNHIYHAVLLHFAKGGAHMNFMDAFKAPPLAEAEQHNRMKVLGRTNFDFCTGLSQI